jgi:enamine deaminase RidA (YjgF/YER057c/UK114 family)
MEKINLTSATGAKIQGKKFSPGAEGASEIHLSITPGEGKSIEEEILSLEEAQDYAQSYLGMDSDNAVFKRIFSSDYVNQYHYLRQSKLVGINGNDRKAISIVEQPPLPGKKIALWSYHVVDSAPLAKISSESGMVLKRNGQSHIWFTSLYAGANGKPKTSYDQTKEIFTGLIDRLGGFNSTLKDNVIRTWIYVQNIDNNYAGMVKARKELFRDHGLSADSHFIASTGIEGRFRIPDKLVLCDAYSVCGISPEQIRYLKSSDRLGPTSDYGVTFERGTLVDYGDRSHVFISGTASIDNKGNTLHERDITKQIERLFYNIEGLLNDAEMNYAHVAQMIIYLRDHGDYPRLRNYLDKNYGDLPAIIVMAPVCRPEWLIEAECVALKENRDSRWNNF